MNVFGELEGPFTHIQAGSGPESGTVSKTYYPINFKYNHSQMCSPVEIYNMILNFHIFKSQLTMLS